MIKDKLRRKVYDMKAQQAIDYIKKNWPEIETLGIDIDFILEKIDKDPQYFDKLSDRAKKDPNNISEIPQNGGTIINLEPDEKKN